MYGPANGTLGSLTAVALAVARDRRLLDPQSNGGILIYNAPWHGSLAGHIAESGTAPAIAGA